MNEDLEKYNKTGMRDAYFILKYLRKHPYKKSERKGGKKMLDGEENKSADADAQPQEEQPINPADQAQEHVDEKEQEKRDLEEKDEDGDPVD